MTRLFSFFLSVSVLLCFGLAADTEYYFPKLYQSLWSDFCLDHLSRYPNECSEHFINENNNHSSEAQIDQEVISRLSKGSLQIPNNSNKCDFLFCKNCRSPALRKICSYDFFYDPEDTDCDVGSDIYIDDSDWTEDEVCYRCACLHDWYHESYWSNDEDRELVEDHWSGCQNKAVPHRYFDARSKHSLPFLEQHLEYSQENPGCVCYWPYRSRKAFEVSDTVYNKMLPLIEGSRLKWNCAGLPHLRYASTHDILSHLFIHSFFYSQYRMGLLQLARWMEMSKANIFGIDKELNSIYGTLEEMRPQFLSLYSECLQKHPHPKIYYERGMLHFHQGNALDSLSDITALIDWASAHKREDLLDSNLYLQEGTFYAEIGLYDRAVEALSEAIRKDPGNKAAFLERSFSYFELGEWDQSLSDYLNSGVVPEPIPTGSLCMLSFSKGLAKGVLMGGAQAGAEFIPSLLASLHGIGHGLWAFAEDPVRVSTDLVKTSQACIEFIRDHTPKETVCRLVPELQELLAGWNQFSHKKRGEAVGHLIGKYGVDLFAGMGVAKGVQRYRDLSRANQLLTLKAMALSERNKTLIGLEAKARAQARKEVLKHANLRIQWDKQGKHIQGHRNYIISDKKSILIHPNPQKLIDEFSGKGLKAAKVHPGTSGYQEIVDFKEFVGYTVVRETGEKSATSWGKIHYAKDGVHIVPTKARR